MTNNQTRAKDSYRLAVRKSGVLPAFVASPDRIDHVEIVEIESGESVLFWDRPVREAASLIKSIRRDLATLDSETFMLRWHRRDERNRDL